MFSYTRSRAKLNDLNWWEDSTSKTLKNWAEKFIMLLYLCTISPFHKYQSLASPFQIMVGFSLCSIICLCLSQKFDGMPNFDSLCLQFYVFCILNDHYIATFHFQACLLATICKLFLSSVI